MTRSTIERSEQRDFVELHDDVSNSPLYNEDLAPTSIAQRTWSVWSIAALWISMSACIPTYMLASGLIDLGMAWKQAVVTIFLGNLIVLIPMILNAHAGTRYGIPFPVYCRASFGTIGANIPALLRALVACGWFGIQTWLGGAAVFAIAVVMFPSLAPPRDFSGVTAAQFVCFLIFWVINVAVIIAGINSIRMLLNIKAPLLIVLGLILLGWAYRAAGGFGPMLSQPSAFDPGQAKAGQFWKVFWPALTGNIAFWATLSLNIPDFSRYARGQRDQIVGQSLGLPLTMALYSFIGVAVTSSTVIIFGHEIWDPVVLLRTFKNPLTVVFAMLALILATLATNIAANVVSPANDFANLAPRVLGFRAGGLITAFLGIFMMPWKILETSGNYIFIWLGGYSNLLGAIGGILICDYWLLRRRQLDLPALYDPRGRYRYTGGFNLAAVIALVIAILPCIPGFIAVATGGKVSILQPLHRLYDYNWFVSFGIAFALYFVLMKFSGGEKHG
ncbi:MAG: NCS1 family nucleobase:cation symporter-1, partial [Anaerolineae bacterium]|nr:NCS1 family nucleobase:cation symporter-1 [Phycisphaerae bacterium]